MSIDRLARRFHQRRLMLRAGGLAASTMLPLRALADATATLPFGNGDRQLVAYPQKRPLLRVHTRPPHLETPFGVFAEGAITPNDAFFVRYHLANLPTTIDATTWRLRVHGRVAQALSLSLADLKSLAPPVEVVAVNQCSGNSRGFSDPRVFGAQLGNGSMGNARWVGVPLKAVLAKAGLLADAKQVAFNGIDTPVLPTTPDFIKALPVEHATGDEPLIAWSMNGSDIPFLNGYPIKLVVPGYFGTYWVKHLDDIEVLDHDESNFFMSTGYRVPDNDCACVEPGTTPAKTRPIGRLPIRSFITSLQDDSRVKAGQRLQVRGIAFDGGSGVRKVELSDDGGAQWREATLGRDLGRFSFREWSHAMVPAAVGSTTLMVRATANDGQVQPMKATWNPSGYQRNVIETTRVSVTA